MTQCIFRNTFDEAVHDRFTNISHDCNPVHADRIAARRTHVGARIVHGVHSLVWALDCVAQTAGVGTSAFSLRVRFIQPIYVGDHVTSTMVRDDSSNIRVTMAAGGEDVATIALGCDSAPRASVGPLLSGSGKLFNPPTAPLEYKLADMERLCGFLQPGTELTDIQTLYPNAVRLFGIASIVGLLQTSYLVGMVAPGLHSIFSGLDVVLSCSPESAPGPLQFSVESINQRFRLLRIAVQGPGIKGLLEAVHRSPPVTQLSMATAKELVSSGEFLGTRALVIGGSRGLGEVAAKLVAAGGGEVIITYASGASDALAVAGEIQRHGLSCDTLRYDVLWDPHEQLGRLGNAPSHVLYFATPLIAKRKSGLFDAARFGEFSSYYLTGFFQLASACSAIQPGELKLFYPSSIFVDERPPGMTEYAMSKAAGELLCIDLARFLPRTRVFSRRLPRLPTDQTGPLTRSEAHEPAKVLLPIIREMHQANQGA